MKFIKIILLVLILGGLGFLYYVDRLPFPRKSITVTGEGKVKMASEVARFSAGTQVFGSTVEEAMKQEKEATDRVLTALKDNGVKPEDIKTSNFSIYPQTSDNYENGVRKTVITGYQVSNNVDVKIRDINKASELLGKVISAGANNVYGISFGADDPKEEEAQARDLAIDDAKTKAEKLAKKAGKQLGGVVTIIEGSQPVYAPYKVAAEGMGGGGGGPAVEPGNLEVVQTVTVTFSLR